MNKRIGDHQLWQLTLANLLEKVREPAVLFWGIGFPILMAIGLGLAFSRKPETVRQVALISADTGQYNLVLRDDKLGDNTFRLTKMRWDEAMILLKRGNINVIITPGTTSYTYHFDPANPDAQLTYLKLAPALRPFSPKELNQWFQSRGPIGHDPSKKQAAQVISDGTEEPAANSGTSYPIVDETVTNPEVEPLTLTGTRYIDFLIPGILAMGVMFSCLWGLGYNIIDTRSKKLLRRMIATPMKRSNYLIAMITVRLLMNTVEAGLLVLFAWMAFGITIQGNCAALILLFLAGNVAFSGIGIFMASHTSKTEIGNAFINIITMPMMVLSGIFFSYYNFPDWVIPVIKPLPLTILTDGIRAIFTEGAGFQQIFIPSLILGITGVVFFTVGLKLFKWH